MRVAMPINWNLNASSLTNIARHNFREIGKIMNETKSFTISAIRWEATYVGDFNQHFDLLHMPNLGGYRFPLQAALHCKNTILGLSGIDEVIYGKEVMTWKESWKVTKPLIDESVKNWKKHINKIKSVYVPAQSERDEMHQYLGIPLEKMTVIPHGLNHDFFKPPNDKEKTRNEILKKFRLAQKKYFLHIGERNWARKNQFRIIDAYIKAKEAGLEHDLIILGKYESGIEKKAKKTPGVHLLGWVSNNHMLKFLQGADALILTSIHEGFGMPLVEAMACGIPSITSNRHAPPEVVSDAGILVNPYSVSEICKAILSLADNESLLEDLSKKSLKRAQLFSWEENSQQILTLYDIDTTKPMENFELYYDNAAYRTLVTVCDLFSDEKSDFINSILKFDYSALVKWAVDYGLDDYKTRDFLVPFEDWLHQKYDSMVVLQ